MEFNQMLVTKKSGECNIEFNGQIIAVKQYLPLMEKYYLSQGIINSCIEEDGRVINYVKKDLAYVYDIINAYTDIDLTSADTLEETADRYDAIVDSGLFNRIIENIPEKELNIINTYIENGLMEIKQFKASPINDFKNALNIINDILVEISSMTPDQMAQVTQIAQNMSNTNSDNINNVETNEIDNTNKEEQVENIVNE